VGGSTYREKRRNKRLQDRDTGVECRHALVKGGKKKGRCVTRRERRGERRQHTLIVGSGIWSAADLGKRGKKKEGHLPWFIGEKQDFHCTKGINIMAAAGACEGGHPSRALCMQRKKRKKSAPNDKSAGARAGKIHCYGLKNKGLNVTVLGWAKGYNRPGLEKKERQNNPPMTGVRGHQPNQKKKKESTERKLKSRNSLLFGGWGMEACSWCARS